MALTIIVVTMSVVVQLVAERHGEQRAHQHLRGLARRWSKLTITYHGRNRPESQHPLVSATQTKTHALPWAHSVRLPVF